MIDYALLSMLLVDKLSLQGPIMDILIVPHEDLRQYEVRIVDLHNTKAAAMIERQAMDVEQSMRPHVHIVPISKSLMLRLDQGLAVQQVQRQCILIVSGSQ